ncbi:MAG: hypothetical protein R3E89_07075 [Thiolinea sp.]
MPFTKLERMLRESRLYEYMLNHPDFLKIQEIASRLWANQTLNKRRIRQSGHLDPPTRLQH